MSETQTGEKVMEAANRRERSESEKMNGDDVMKFVRLLIAGAFSSMIKPETTEEKRADIFSTVLGLAAAKGIHQLLNDIDDKNFSDVVEAYSFNATEFMGQMRWATERAVAAGKVNDAERSLLGFLKSFNVQPVPPRSAGSIMDLLAQAMGAQAPTEDCDCPACQLRRMIQGETDDGPCGCDDCVERREPDGSGRAPTNYRVKCPEHGYRFITDSEYTQQMLDENGWKCPECGADSAFDEDFACDSEEGLS
jgi:hypothetical protein